MWCPCQIICVLKMQPPNFVRGEKIGGLERQKCSGSPFGYFCNIVWSHWQNYWLPSPFWRTEGNNLLLAASYQRICSGQETVLLQSYKLYCHQFSSYWQGFKPRRSGGVRDQGAPWETLGEQGWGARSGECPQAGVREILWDLLVDIGNNEVGEHFL